MVKLRSVQENDLKAIFSWRNQTKVREMMFDSTELNWETHYSFWMKLLKDDLVVAFVITAHGESCGVIKLDLNKSKTIGEVDIFINPIFHGRGIGQKALKELIENLKDKTIKKIIAKVKPQNIGSERMFKKLGFSLNYFQLEYEI